MSMLQEEMETAGVHTKPSGLEKQKNAAAKLLAALREPSEEFSPIPFWFFNDRPDEEKIAAQLKDFAEKGVNGFVLHPRIGIPEDIAYLSEEYFAAVRFIVKTAASFGMKVVLYDEGMYPSGSACGMVAAADPSFAAKGITLQKEPGTGEVLERLADGSCLVKDFTGGTIRGIHFGEDDGEAGAPAAADILNPEAVRLFIRLTHERYYENLKEYFGNTVIGFFTDEPCALGRNAGEFREWADGMEAELEAQGGRLCELAGLFCGQENKTTAIYRRLVKKHLRENFYGQLSAWCEAHGIALMGHPAESDDVEEALYFQVPGQDLILRRVEPKTGGLLEADSVQAKLSADIARHLGRRRNMNECFGVCCRNGIPWYFTGEDMKWYIDWLGIRGVNLFVPHAFYYSVEGKRSGERPPDVGPNNIWWEHYRYFSDYMKRMSLLMTDSVNDARVAVLCDNNRVPAKEVAALYENQIEFNYLPVQLLSKCRVEEGALCIRDYRYRVVLDVIGKTAQRDADNMLWRQVEVVTSAEEILLREKRRKKDSCCGTEQDSIKGLHTMDQAGEPVVCPSLRATHFRRMGTECWLFSNEGAEPVETMLRLDGIQGRAAVWMDLWKGTCRSAAEEEKTDGRRKGELFLSLKPCETRLLLVASLGEALPQIPKAPQEKVPDDWTERFCLKEKRNNRAVYEYCFETDCPDMNASFLVRGEEMAECFCNGSLAGVSFWNEHQFLIGPWLKKGKNELQLVLTGNAANLFTDADIFHGLCGCGNH